MDSLLEIETLLLLLVFERLFLALSRCINLAFLDSSNFGLLLFTISLALGVEDVDEVSDFREKFLTLKFDLEVD